jgi:hypothetical protein
LEATASPFAVRQTSTYLQCLVEYVENSDNFQHERRLERGDAVAPERSAPQDLSSAAQNSEPGGAGFTASRSLDSKRAKRTIAFGSRCLLLDVTRVQHGVVVRDTEKSPPILWVVRYLYMQTPTSPARCLAFVQSSIVL